MHATWLLFALGLPLLVLAAVQAQPEGAKAVLVVHGGAGALKDELTPEMEKQCRADLEAALKAGYAALKHEGGTSLDAVEAAVRVLEDSPLFNAGRGAVFNREGGYELNASIMEGKEKRAGAVAGVLRIKNPVSAARLVMEKSEHVFLIGEGAERFARTHGLVEAAPLYFWTERRWQQLLRHRAKANKQSGQAESSADHFGTVGAVALDSAGNLAAATSTGGIANKLPGRVGDSPVIGAGTYADNAACAVSCTGHGEIFLRHAVAHDLVARMKYKNLALRAAADEVFRALPPGPRAGGGVGGLIALDRQGNVAMPFNTGGMFRGYVTADGTTHVAIFDR